MPIIKSAKKRVKVAKKATAQNLKTKRSLKSAMKSVRLASTSKTLTDAQRSAQSALDKAGKKGIMHKHKVARKQRQLSARVKAAGVTSAKSTTAKKAPATATKKPAAKKTTKK